ncbi:MAG TPA: hypothetical protein VD930_13470 [Gemmatimonadales bacterium]|nr:hypothetical protein [Gemmatimonadales bacterium]
MTGAATRPKSAPHVTLVLTRTPYDEFVYEMNWKTKSLDVEDDVEGNSPEWWTERFQRNAPYIRANRPKIIASALWGTLAVFKGAKVLSCTWAGTPPPFRMITPATMLNDAMGQLAAAARGAPPPPLATSHSFQMAGRTLQLTTEPGGLSMIGLYTTIERFRDSLGQTGATAYVQVRESPEPYRLYPQHGNTVVQTLRAGHNGRCLRIQQRVPAATARAKDTWKTLSILIHEAPAPQYVIGCIGPRPLGHKRMSENKDGNEAQVATEQVIDAVEKIGGREGQLFVV